MKNIQYERYDNYYDLHIVGEHNYYAQGVFHHNCGKSLMLILKAIQLSLKYPNNYILMGRKTYQELRDSLWKEFFILCPDQLIKAINKAEMKVTFNNGSEIIFRHLDKIAESEIKSLNLGVAFIDQVEDIAKEVFLALVGRLRRNTVDDKDKRIYMSCNPALTWLYSDFKQTPMENSELIEASTLENKENLSPAYIESLLQYPETWKKQYVYGVWDASLLSDRTVFAREHIEKLMGYERKPVLIREGLEIYKEFVSEHRYQLGLDPAEGMIDGDEASITIVDLTTLEEAACWSGRVPPDVAAEYAGKFARWYQDNKSRCLVVPEINSVGLAALNKLAADYELRIYKREEFDKRSGQKTEKLGWRMTRGTKPLAVSRFQELLRLAIPKVYSRTIEQFKTFVYTDESRKHGMGAQTGFHDDRLISLLLAFWEKKPAKESIVLGSEQRDNKEESGARLRVKNGKIIKMPQIQPVLEIIRDKSWKI